MQISTFWTRWLLVVCGIMFLFGLILVFAPSLILESFGSRYYNQFFGHEDVFSTLTSAEISFQHFVYGIMGAVIMAWISLIIGLITIPFRRGEAWAWKLITVSVLIWFEGDSYVSIVTGFPLHALANVGFLVLMVLPLIATYRQFHPKDNRQPQPARI